MSGKPWCAAERMMLRRYGPYLTAAVMGQLIGRSRHGVLWQAKQLNIKVGPRRGDKHHSRKYPEADIQLAKQLRDAGMKIRIIEEKLEIHPGSLKNFLY